MSFLFRFRRKRSKILTYARSKIFSPFEILFYTWNNVWRNSWFKSWCLYIAKFLGRYPRLAKDRNASNGPFVARSNPWQDYFDVINAHVEWMYDTNIRQVSIVFRAISCRFRFLHRDWINATSFVHVLFSQDPPIRRDMTRDYPVSSSSKNTAAAQERLINLQFLLWVSASETFSTAARVLETRLREFEDLLRAKF